MSKKIPAVAYYRMSTDRQETSIADQRAAVQKYAKENGYRIIEEYADEGVSGWKSTQRKSFQRMIDNASSREFKAVIVWDQDRFSRFEVREFMHYWHILAESGVDIVSVAQGKLDDNDLGWLTTGITQHGKSQYSRDLSRNVCRGMREKRLSGEWFGRAPYGMKIVGRKLAPGKPSEIRVVRRIFELRLAGHGTHVIAVKLNDDGIPTALGKPLWKSQTVADILERHAYVGDCMVSKFKGGQFERLADEPTLIKNTHEGIIDRETFDRVQAIPKQERKHIGRGSGGKARLRGFLWCGKCGGPMYSLKMRNGEYIYRCGNYSDATRRADGQRCVHCAVKMKQIEEAVFDRISMTVLMGGRDRLEAAIKRELKRRQRAAQDVTGEAAAIKREIAKLDGQIERATERVLLIDDDLLPGAEKKLRELKGRRDRISEPLSTNPAFKLPSAGEIADRAWQLDETLRRGTAQQARLALESVVSGITCDFEFDRERSTEKRQRYKFVRADIVLRDKIGTAPYDR